MKRMLALTLALLMVLVSGTASAAINDTGYPISDEKITLSMVVAANPDYNPRSDMWFFQQMEAMTNIRMEIEHVSSAAWEERRNLMFAANELPDVILGGLSNAQIITYSNAKQIIALNDYIDKYAPNYVDKINRFPELDRSKLYDPAGNMVGLAGTLTGGYMEVQGARSFINKQWLDNLGLKMPETYDEFYDVLVAFRDKDPNQNGKADEVPLSGVSTGYMVDAFVAGPLGIPFGWVEKSMWLDRDGVLVYLPTDPIYKEYLTRMNKLYTEKLLDEEYYTQNDAQMRAKGANMQIGACTYAAPFVLLSTTDATLYEQYVATPPMTSDFSSEKAWYGNAVGAPNIFITSVNKYPEATLRYFDWVYTEEGAKWIYGPEKGAWDGQGGVVWTDDKTSWSVEVPEGYTGIFAWLSKEVSPIGSGLQGWFQYSEYCKAQTMTPEDRALYNTLYEAHAPYMKPSFPPTIYFTVEEQEKISLVQTDLTTYVKQMEAKFVMGEESLDNFDAFVQKVEAMQASELTKLYNDAYAKLSKEAE